MRIEELLTDADYHERDYTERSDDDVVKVTVESLEKGTATVFLPEDTDVEIANDGPSEVTVSTL